MSTQHFKLKYFIAPLTALSLLLIYHSPVLASFACGPNSMTLPGGNCLPFPSQANTAIINFEKASIGDVITSLMPYFFVFAGLTMLVLLIIGGFQLMTSAGDPKSIQSGQSKITSALIGFGIIFAAYWIAQILQVIFHITIVTGP